MDSTEDRITEQIEFSRGHHETEIFFDAIEESENRKGEERAKEDKTSFTDDADEIRVLETEHEAVEDGSDEDVEDDDDDDDDKVSSEPKLKYERLSSDLKAILADDTATTIAVHPKFLLVGTNWGRLHLLDALGNAMPAENFEKKFSVAVSQVSVDHSGEYVAACSSSEGKVIICGLYTKENNHNMMMNAAVNAVAIDPIYARPGSGRRFMTGDDRVILHEKTYFSRYKQTFLSDAKDGPITSLKWRGRFAAWCGRRGVLVYDVVEEKTISLIKHVYNSNNSSVTGTPSSAAMTRDENGRSLCRISWADQYTLFVSMGDTVNLCTVKRRDPNEAKLKDLPEHFVEIRHKFSVPDQWICGVAPMKECLVLLTVPKEGVEERRPQLLIIEPSEDGGYSEISTDLLSLRGYETHRASDYHLEYLIDDQHYFIVSPKDIVVGQPRDEDDHIDWLLEKRSFGAALDYAEESARKLRRHNVLKVGRSYLDFLIENANFDAAGKLCIRLYNNNAKLWQEEIVRFERLNQLKALAPFVPLGPNHGKQQIQLESSYYEMILLGALKTDKSDGEAFLQLVRTWPPELYNIGLVVNHVVEVLLVDPENVMLQRALATLFSYQKKYDKAMAMYLKLGHKDVFQLIRKHDIFSVLFDKIPDLMELDEREAIKLFLEHPEKLSTDLIVQRLDGYDKHLHAFLDALLVHNYEVSKKYHGLLVGLYADYNYDKLMPFLRSSDHYPIQDALEACEIRGLTPERIFILARMGSTRQALHLITRELSDIHRAVDFCKEYDDVDLWNDLIDYSIDKPYFVNVLLHNIGTHVDPAILIQKIECGQRIPGLRDSLVQILHDYHLQVSLQEGCKRILVADCFSLIQRQVKCQSRGTSVLKESICGGCLAPIIEARRSKSSDAVVFMCRHAFHADCISDDSNQCTICNSKKMS